MGQDTQQDRSNLVAGTANWGETPAQPPLDLRRRNDFSRLNGVEELPYMGPRFETETPRSFNEWRSQERRELRQQGRDLLQGRPVNGWELLGNVLTNVVGNQIRREDSSRGTEFDRMNDHRNGVDRDRDGYRR